MSIELADNAGNDTRVRVINSYTAGGASGETGSLDDKGPTLMRIRSREVTLRLKLGSTWAIYSRGLGGEITSVFQRALHWHFVGAAVFEPSWLVGGASENPY